jgi:hypothetical protein
MSMPRPCSICAHPERARIEQALADGYRVSQVVRDYAKRDHFSISADALGRHIRQHLAPELRAALTNVSGLGAVSIASRMRAIADAAREAREVAYAAGRTTLGIRAGDAEARALALLADRLGIVHEQVLDDVEFMDDFIEAVRTLTPTEAEPLALALVRMGRSDTAENVRIAASHNIEQGALTA